MVWFAFTNTALTTVYWMNNSDDNNDWLIKGNTF